MVSNFNKVIGASSKVVKEYRDYEMSHVIEFFEVRSLTRKIQSLIKRK
jgi:hypothetical protein